MKWSIHYDDGTVKHGTEKTWAKAPATGVLIVVVGDDLTNVHHGRDNYLLRGTTLMSFDDTSLVEQAIEGFSKGALKRGKYVEHETWRRVWNAAFPDQPI